MRNWRVLTAIAAVVLAVIAGVLAWQYLSEADERASEDFELVPAFVAARNIPEGTLGSEAVNQDLIEQTEVPRQNVPEAAITDLEQITDNVAVATISAGQFITTDTFVSPLQARNFAQAIDRGKQAISFSVDSTRGVGGFVVPNDTVNVLVTFESVPLGQPQPVPGEEGQPPAGITEELTTTAYLLSGLKVLAVGNTTATTTSDGTEGEQDTATGVITVEVDAFQAEQIAHAAAQGSIYLSLNPPGADPLQLDADVVEIVEAVNWFEQQLGCLGALRGALDTAPAETPAVPAQCAPRRP